MPPRSELEWIVPPLFAYGLLRPGERYWAQLEPAVRRRQPARVRGRLHLHASGAYPMLDCAGGSWVYGDLLEVEHAEVVHALVFMELTAGYDARWVDVFALDGDEPLGAAIAFCWPWSDTHRGEQIASGDWQRRPPPAPA
jgi:gamma-glutamylcyclotransferase (GGCT)/AIG2-like uncharacterized protein YtfP